MATPVRRAPAHTALTFDEPSSRARSVRAWTRRRLFSAARPGPFESPAHWIRVQRHAMACRFEITLDARDARCVPAAQEALNIVDALEAQLTVFRDTSELVHINTHAADAPVPCEPLLFGLLSR